MFGLDVCSGYRDGEGGGEGEGSLRRWVCSCISKELGSDSGSGSCFLEFELEFVIVGLVRGCI